MPKSIKRFILRKNSEPKWIEVVADTGIEFHLKRALRNDMVKLSKEAENADVPLDEYTREWSLVDWRPKEALIDDEGNQPSKSDIFNDPLFGNALDMYIFGSEGIKEKVEELNEELKN